MQKRFRFWILFKECFENMKKSTKNPHWFAPKLPKMRKNLKKWLLFSCVFIFAGTVDDSVFCNHFSFMGKLVIFYYPIATPFRKHRSDIWNVVDIFFIADDVYPTPPPNHGDVISVAFTQNVVWEIHQFYYPDIKKLQWYG